MQFNERVLEEARDPANPLLERVKFLAITASNLDEFVEVRVAGLLQQVEQGNREPGPDGRTPEKCSRELTARIHRFVERAIRLLARRTGSGPRRGIHPRPGSRRTAARRLASTSRISTPKTVEPLLTPVTVDPAHPFPHVLNKALCLAFLLKRKRRGSQTYLGVVTVPRALPRLVLAPFAEGNVEYVFLHDVVHAFAERLYHGYEILSAAAFRVTRNSNLYLRGRGIAQHPGIGGHATASPPERLGGPPGNRGGRRSGNHRATARRIFA